MHWQSLYLPCHSERRKIKREERRLFKNVIHTYIRPEKTIYGRKTNEYRDMETDCNRQDNWIQCKKGIVFPVKSVNFFYSTYYQRIIKVLCMQLWTKIKMRGSNGSPKCNYTCEMLFQFPNIVSATIHSFHSRFSLYSQRSEEGSLLGCCAEPRIETVLAME